MTHFRFVNLKGAKAESFGALAAFFYRMWAEPALAPMHERIAEEPQIVRGKLLDIGCGPGRLTRRIAERRPEVGVTGLDLSADMIRQARRGPVLANLEFRQGTPASAGFSNEYEMALSILSFHHWEEPVEEVSAVHRALKPGGRLWIYEQDAEASNAELHADRAPLWGFLRVPGCWQRLLARGHGFTRREVEEVVRPAVARTPFRTVQIDRTGSTFRLELTKENTPSGAIDNAGDRR
ncbi:MAG: class I SAM-dependent methyltransferase [Thermoanaerobaculia bacterium]